MQVLLFKMRSYWIKVGPKSNITGVLEGRERTLRYTEQRQPYDEGGRMWSGGLQTREHQQPREPSKEA